MHRTGFGTLFEVALALGADLPHRGCMVADVIRATDLALGGTPAPPSEGAARDGRRSGDLVTARVLEDARAAGRAAETVPLAMSACCEATDDVEAAGRRIKPIRATIGRNGDGPLLASPSSRTTCPMSSTAYIRTWCTPRTPPTISPRRPRALHAGSVRGMFPQDVGSYDPPTDLIEAVGASVLPALRRKRRTHDGHEHAAQGLRPQPLRPVALRGVRRR
ncbi:hypothetical protein [Streptomyces sp. NPDC127119]|uniref:hypothetical protein n=1 Tax=Streptomyces sp. NPDC127119 TaxID=3345370 RepID=UPI00362A9249